MTTNPLTLAAVRAIKEEAEKATQGPWDYEHDQEGSSMGWVSSQYPNVAPHGWNLFEVLGDSAEQCMNAEFIAHARTNVPAICDTIETLVEALRLVVDSPHEAHNKAIAELLATIDPPSGEAQTEGDGG